MYNSISAPQVGGARAQSSVLYPPWQMQFLAEMMEQMNWLKLGFSNLKMLTNELKMDTADLRGQLTNHLMKNGCG
jgi:hypothetical protein